jgi:hypothetical protein
MLGVMRDNAADCKRRDAMAMAAAPYLHPRLTAIESSVAGNPSAEIDAIRVEFVLPSKSHSGDGQE